MKHRTLRAIVCSLCAVAALVIGVALAGCQSGPTPEELIRQDITKNFDQIKNLDDEMIEELSQTMDTSSLEPYGIDGTELIKSMVDGFDYTIDSVTVDEGGGTAVATLTVTSKPMSALYNEVESIFTEILESPDAFELLSDQDALNKKVGEMLMQAVEQIEPTEKQIELTYSKTDDGWEIDASSASEISMIFVGDASVSSTSATISDLVQEDGQDAAPDASTPDASGTTSQQNALESARSYLDYSHFSYTGLIDQLEFEGFSTEDATWAADNCGADWNEQALGSAQDYLDFSAFSYTGLIDQLEFEGFTTEQATYAADGCGADWNEQAAKSAQDYLDFSSFSRDELIGQLEFEGFTHDQAVYGVDSVGL